MWRNHITFLLYFGIAPPDFHNFGELRADATIASPHIHFDAPSDYIDASVLMDVILAIRRTGKRFPDGPDDPDVSGVDQRPSFDLAKFATIHMG